MVWRWFGVKTVLRTEAGGAAETLVEERVVLVRARTADEAIRRAEREAAAYAGEPFLNRDGALVRRRYLGGCTSYELFDDDARRLGDARGTIEVFSSTRLVAAGTPDEEVVARILGGAVSDREWALRWSTFVPASLAAGEA